MNVTAQNIDALTHQQLYEEFVYAMCKLVDMDASEYADNHNDHLEWVARNCWERMTARDKEEVKLFVPNVENCMTWGDMSYEVQMDIYRLCEIFYDE